MKVPHIFWSFSTIALLFLLSKFSHAHDGAVQITSADICAPVNVGKANRSIQNIRGEIRNTSSSEAIAVSCPLATAISNENFGLLVVAGNLNDLAQDVKCVLREKDSFNLDVQTLTRTVNVLPTSLAELSWDIFRVTGPRGGSRFNLTCLLPPLTSLGALVSLSVSIDEA